MATIEAGDLLFRTVDSKGNGARISVIREPDGTILIGVIRDPVKGEKGFERSGHLIVEMVHLSPEDWKAMQEV